MTNSELFPSSLIDQALKDSLPESYILRSLSRDDYSKGFFECLRYLASTGDVTEDRFLQQFDWMRDKAEEIFYNVVIEHENRIVANGMLIVERKL